MTREELEAFDKEQQEKGWLKNLIDLWPSYARWEEACKIVVDKAMEAPLSSWLGLKLGELIGEKLQALVQMRLV